MERREDREDREGYETQATDGGGRVAGGGRTSATREKVTKMTKMLGGRRGENPRIGAKVSKASKMTRGREWQLRGDDSLRIQVM
jgi:hypothetical protein